jgi:hypothetical protein
LSAERRLDGGFEPRPSRPCRCPLFPDDALGDPSSLIVARASSYALQLLVGGDLEVLEGEREAGQLRRGVRLGPEERPEIYSAHAQKDALEAGRAFPARFDARADGRLLSPCLLEVVRENLLQFWLSGDRLCLLEEL